MENRISRIRTGRMATKGFLFATILMLFAIATAYTEANAQTLCCDVTIANNTTCEVEICLNLPFGPFCLTVPAHTTIKASFPCNPVAADIVLCGLKVPIPTGGCLHNARLGPGCCASVCFTGCTITVDPSPVLLCLCP
jgi:hypothetical protein